MWTSARSGQGRERIEEDACGRAYAAYGLDGTECLALSEEDACGTLRAMWRRTKMLKLKLILRRAYGFRNLQNMTDMIMLCCSDLEVVLLGDDASAQSSS